MAGSANSGYICDLPVRLNRKFYPLPKLDGLPDRSSGLILQYPVEALVSDYDFSVEKKALQDYQSNLQRYTTQSNTAPTTIDSNQSDIDSSTDNISLSSGSNSSTSSRSNISTTVKETPFDMPRLVNGITNQQAPSTWLVPSNDISAQLLSTSGHVTNGILQPTIAKSPIMRSINKEIDQRSILRLEDFENVTSSPFDMCELKSINDIEELRRMWTQPSSNGYVS